jgi:hypothetical protein
MLPGETTRGKFILVIVKLFMKLTAEYIRGFAGGESTFTFSTRAGIDRKGKKQYRRPAFVIKMHVRDKALLEAIRDYWGLKECVYEYIHHGNDGRTRHQAMLIVRNFADLKNIIVPFFLGKLHGYKGKQFVAWLEQLGGEDVAPDFRLIYRLYKSGFYSNPKNLLYKWE